MPIRYNAGFCAPKNANAARNRPDMHSGRPQVIQRHSFSLDAGGLMQVGGANGSGKTSLLRMLCGLAIPLW